MKAKRKGATQTSIVSRQGKVHIMKKAERDRIMAGAPMPVFKPLKSWPAREHLRQGEIDALKAAPSVFDNRGR